MQIEDVGNRTLRISDGSPSSEAALTTHPTMSHGRRRFAGFRQGHVNEHQRQPTVAARRRRTIAANSWKEYASIPIVAVVTTVAILVPLWLLESSLLEDNTTTKNDNRGEEATGGICYE